ncbi:hypothetical protein CONPUDRAFT_57272, partial [Coniophora puteana RWD-64-598 SS2]
MSCLLFNVAIEPLAALLRQSELRGYDVPDMAERVIVSMFADDTTVYLRKEDDFVTLQSLLDLWCHASGAKFNVNKTEVIPIGSPVHRKEVEETRCLAPSQQPLPPSIRIAKDGSAVRILGAWMGNGIDQAAIWSPVIDDIKESLERWDRLHPTMEGRSILIQWFVCGKTQYLTNAQGMPKSVEDELSLLTRQFAWDNAGRSTINAPTLQ